MGKFYEKIILVTCLKTTEEILRGLTDSARFEQIATRVLRIIFPELKSLIVTGLNEKGETRKDPFDAFAELSYNHFAMVHHTIDDSNLEAKWLNNSLNSKRPKGDLIKAIEKAKEIRSVRPDSRFTVFLVTNQPVTTQLQIRISEANPHAYIRTEIVELSKLAYYLDYNAEGQYIRKQWLGIDADLLSDSLLRELMHQNFQQYRATLFLLDDIIETEGIEIIQNSFLDSKKKLNLLVGASGFGKSTAACFIMESVLANGGNALRIHPQIVLATNSYIEAIGCQLNVEHARLFINKETILQVLAKPTIIVIDDINDVDRPQSVLDKLLSWELIDRGILSVQVLCPVWPKHMRLLERKVGQDALFEQLSVHRLSRKDTVDFIKRKTEGIIELTIPQIHAIARDTDGDPLLISLYLEQITETGIYIPNQGQEVVWNFIRGKLNKQADEGTEGEMQIMSATRDLGQAMMHNRILNPTYHQLKQWFRNEPLELSTIESIAKQRHLFYFDDSEQLIFRHDRVRDFIMVLSCEKQLAAFDNHQSILSDPFYAEIIGTALSRVNIGDVEIGRLVNMNPVSVFYSLKFLQSAEKQPLFDTVLGSIHRWKQCIQADGIPESISKNILLVLLGFDTREIKAITDGFQEGLEFYLARFRNAEGIDGVKYFACYDHFPPTFTNYWRNVTIDHIKGIHYTKVIDDIKNLLTQTLTERGRIGVYLLSGYLRSPDLTPLLVQEWNNNPDPKEFIYYAWAIFNCFSKDQHQSVRDVLYYWQNLPDSIEEDKGPAKGVRTRTYLEFYRTNWELAEEQILFFCSLAEDQGYGKLVYAVLSSIDSPDALRVIIKETSRERKAKKDAWESIFDPRDERWDYHQYRYRLSKDSLQFLLSHWQNRENEGEERILAFRFWRGNEQKEIVLQKLLEITSNAQVLYKSAIFWRASIGDQSVTEPLVGIIADDPKKIMWAAMIWNDELKACTKKVLQHGIEQGNGNIANQVLGLLFKVNEKDAEEILIEFWEFVKHLHPAISLSLFLATPKTRALAKTEIDRLGYADWDRMKYYYRGPSEGHFFIPDIPEDLSGEEKYNISFLAEEFSHLYFNYGQEERLTAEKLDSLLPYLKLMTPHNLDQFAQKCMRVNLMDWVFEHVYLLLSPEDQKKYKPTDHDIVSELHDIARGNYEPDLTAFVIKAANRGIDGVRFARCLELYSATHRSLKDLYWVGKCVELLGTRKNISLIENFQVNQAPEDIEVIKKGLIYRVLRTTLQ